MFLYRIMLFILITILSTSSVTYAAGPVAAAPAVAVGVLEVLVIGSTVATAAGILNKQQQQQFELSVQDKQDGIFAATERALMSSQTGVIILMAKVPFMSSRNVCPPTSNTGSGAGQCNAGPNECCKDYFKKFEGRVEHYRGGVRIYKKAGKQKLQCCLEWDHTHGGFEIFDTHGDHGTKRHMGERGCDDLNEDPCSWSPTRGSHAAPNTATHQPRTRGCQQL